MRKKLLSLLLVCPMLLSLVLPAYAARTMQFTDINSKQWFYSYVRDLYNDRIIDGTSATTFSPTRTVTLGQTLKLILLSAGYAEQPSADGHWAGGYLQLARKLDLLGSASSLGLNDPVTRQQIAEIAVGAMKLQRTKTGASPFADTSDPSALILYDHSVITGIRDKSGKLVFNPGGKLTRAEISAIIWRLKQLKPVTTALNLSTPVVQPDPRQEETPPPPPQTEPDVTAMTEPQTQPEPEKTTEPATKPEPVKPAEPAAQPEPAKTTDPPAQPEPAKTAEPAAQPEPAKTAESSSNDASSDQLPDWLVSASTAFPASSSQNEAGRTSGQGQTVQPASQSQTPQAAASNPEPDMPDWLNLNGGGAGFASQTAESESGNDTATASVSGPEPDPENDWRDETVQTSSSGPTRYLTFRGNKIPVVEGIRQNPYQNDLFRTNQNGFLTYDSAAYTSRIGIDVSSHQGDIDWAAVRSAGVDFALIRLGYRGYSQGGLVMDAKFYRNIQGALDNGIDVGVYFFSQALNAAEGAEEARFCLNAVRNYNLTYPIIFDWEPYASSVNARTKGLSNYNLTQATVSFCKTVQTAGYQPMVYNNLTYFYLHLDLSQVKSYPFWLAQYNSRPSFYYAFDIWQYSSTGRVSGINGNVDLNIEFVPK